ncbi:MAG: hypothetical protein IPH74_09395 [Bacteroidetes bacterium]|jgi:hypothetical protein|nr:hypothetical protein [Bacteroidota bacterium]MBP7255627.1 hypothetical protein [Chitinophagales bacterium]MBK7139215.1 hypothetical protein [Bacteroidota bacterium]MBK7504618.1 hypothetical protein [Bacteroidota bacterium]MBK7640101.1 hypothetical protein [Bacteroidota bacterium]
MKRKIIIAFLALINLLSYAGNNDKNSHELGIGIGAANFLGDLGGFNKIGTPFLKDVEPKLFRPDLNVFYRYNINYHFAAKANIMFTRLQGRDNLTQGEVFSDQWYRQIRNLSFKSYIVDISGTLELNFLKYKPGDVDEYDWSPYIFVGGSGFYFNPTTTDAAGNKVKLQPLGTEGQGMPGYGDKYKRFSFAALMGAGIKWNLTRRLSMAWDVVYYHTFTDYIDDVSTVYANRTDFNSFYGPEQGQYIADLAERRVEIDPTNAYGFVTAAGVQRGDPKDKDQLFTTNISFAIRLGEVGYRGRGYKGGRLQCPKF